MQEHAGEGEQQSNNNTLLHDLEHDTRERDLSRSLLYHHLEEISNFWITHGIPVMNAIY